MSGHSVEKIGGTSMAATSTLFDNVLVAGRSGDELYRRIFVVSAYAGMTDLLLEHKKSGEPGVYARFARGEAEWREALERVRDAMCERNSTMFARSESLAHADRFVHRRIEALNACLDDLDRLRGHGRFSLKDQLVTVREMLAGLGEAHSAHSTALLLRDRGVNAVFVDLTVWSEEDKVSLDRRILDALEPLDLSRQMPIVTGYAGCEGGMIRRYARGYSEMTFSRIAVLTKASRAIITRSYTFRAPTRSWSATSARRRSAGPTTTSPTSSPISGWKRSIRAPDAGCARRRFRCACATPSTAWTRAR
jgi:aspartate kinase